MYMKPTIYDLLEGLTRKENPNAVYHFFILLSLIFLFVLVSRYFTNRPKIIKKKKDEEVYNYIIKLKKLKKDDIELLENIIKRYDIKDKYNLLIMEGKFQKYMEMEIINIEQSTKTTTEKEILIENYNKLKRKIFDNCK